MYKRGMSYANKGCLCLMLTKVVYVLYYNLYYTTEG